MPRCPNCGRTAARTEDWACQWCGYPLLSGSYKKIPKTYKQLEEERLSKQRPPLEEEAEPIPEPEIEPEPEPVPELEPEPVAETEPTLQPEPEPALALMKVTAEELYLAYEVDKVAADKKFADKNFEVTGVVDRIVVNDMHDIYYVILTSAEKKKEWNVRCTFDKKQAPNLNRLASGQTVTVQGLSLIHI